MNRTRREIEALADLFVGPASTELPGDRIAILLEGHLPVRGALWRVAAAELMAASKPATLLDVDDRQVHATSFGGEPCDASTLEHLVARPAAGHLWIVAGSEVVTDPQAIDVADELVLVTGADQAAVVGAYRLAKQVIASAPAGIGVGLIIAGSPHAQAEDVWNRLADTLRTHLSVEPRLIGVLPKLDVSEPPTHTTVPMPSEGAAMLVDALHARPSERPANTTGPTAEAAPPPVTRVPPIPATPTSVEPRPPGNYALPDGLTACGIELPLPPEVQLAVDATGSVHLVAGEAAVASLESARHWAERHLPLLVAAEPNIQRDRPIVCDVLVEDYHRAAELAWGPWQVHLVHEGGMLPVPRPS